jgi:pyrimidine operon attenuation protein/uracil phosphoribosyltransferase
MSKLPDAEALCEKLARELKGKLPATAAASIAMVGIHTGGVWLAERLHAALALATPLGALDAALYRDDYSTQGLAKDPKRSQIPFEVEGRELLLVDDVLYTGRTVRAALNELFDYGRPASVSLAVLVDRSGRQLPIDAQFCGVRLEIAGDQRLRLKRDAAGKLRLELERGA